MFFLSNTGLSARRRVRDINMDIELLPDNHIFIHQKSAGVVRMLLSSFIIMLPYMSFGTLSAFLTSGLPRLLIPNDTGILVDLYQISWLCE